MIAWLTSAALAAGGASVVVADGPLRPGRAAVLEVGATTGPGAPSPEPPALTLTGGALTGPEPVRDGIWRWTVVPDIDADALQLRLGDRESSLPVAAPPPSPLRAEAVVDAVARGEPVSWRIEGEGPVPVDALEVTPAEGRVEQLIPQEDGSVEVVVALDDLPYPRWVPVAVRDRRVDAQPVWTAIRVRARPRIPMHAEPGAQLTLRIGGRSWGPFRAGADGAIDARIEQLPGDTSATAVLVDDLGNRTQTEVPLVTSSSPALVAVADGEALPGRPPPQVLMWALSPGGRPVEVPPSCRLAGVGGELPVRDLGEGRFLAALPVSEPADQRVLCAVGATTVAVPVPVASGVAARLSLRVWPDELMADEPTAEVSVVLDDARGERLPVRGLAVAAARGTVSLPPPTGIVARGTYDGHAAVEAGEDTVRASYTAPAGDGWPRELAVAAGTVPARGDAVVRARPRRGGARWPACGWRCASAATAPTPSRATTAGPPRPCPCRTAAPARSRSRRAPATASRAAWSWPVSPAPAAAPGWRTSRTPSPCRSAPGGSAGCPSRSSRRCCGPPPAPSPTSTSAWRTRAARPSTTRPSR
ncbi:MAG: hypothetical protein R3F59_32795 [Myxococcota bacterium]